MVVEIRTYVDISTLQADLSTTFQSLPQTPHHFGLCLIDSVSKGTTFKGMVINYKEGVGSFRVRYELIKLILKRIPVEMFLYLVILKSVCVFKCILGRIRAICSYLCLIYFDLF